MNDKNTVNIDTQNVEIPEELPLLANENFVIYPFMIAPLLVRDEAVIRMVDEIVRGNRLLGVFTQRPPREGEEPAPSFFDRVYDVGTVVMILRMLKMPDGTLRLIVHGVGRARITQRLDELPFPRAKIQTVSEFTVDDNETRALQKNAREMLAKLVEQSTSLNNDLLVAANNMDDPGRLADLIASNLSLGVIEQQEILELGDTKRRLLRVEEIMSRELEIANLGTKIQTQVKTNLERTQRDYFLREQLKAIRRELGEESDSGEELDELHRQIQEAGLSEPALKVAEKELARLRSIPPASAEYTVSRTYLDWIITLPWSKQTEDSIDLIAAERILNEDHYDLEKVKQRILEYLAVIKLRRAIRGPILCLVGPPGVGKTSLGRSVARSMGRKFVRISLGGVRDEAEIRGHRRTYIGSMPGRIIKSLRDAESNNPVFMLDEIDKLGMDFRGDPASALLEVLDPEQNNSFTDHYLDLPFDLSNVMFITTANSLEPIPSPLLDRMEVLRLSGYTLHEKVQIARQYLIPRALDNTGLKPEQAVFTDEAVEYVIENYTREAGLRNLERELTNLCRKVARKVAEGKEQAVTIDRDHVIADLGPERFDRDIIADRTHEPGVVVGLAWTATGGDILFIEATLTAGQGRLTLTGQLGDVMKESVQAARTWLHANARRLGIAEEKFSKHDLHIHVPAGAIPKDGPSAGITMLTAIASLLLGKPVCPRLAMTGEITLKGAVLPIGGLKEKLLAAHRSGVKKLILPRRNSKDLVDIPDEVRQELDIHFVDTADEVLTIAFDQKPTKGKTKKTGRKAGKGDEPAAKEPARRRTPTRAGRATTRTPAARTPASNKLKTAVGTDDVKTPETEVEEPTRAVANGREDQPAPARPRATTAKIRKKES